MCCLGVGGTVRNLIAATDDVGSTYLVEGRGPGENTGSFIV